MENPRNHDMEDLYLTAAPGGEPTVAATDAAPSQQ